MSDLDDDWDDDEQSRREKVIRRARIEGVEAAFEASLRICKDPKAPAQAQSNAARTLLQIGGLLDRADREQQSERKDLAEMTGAELQAEIDRATARQARPRRRPAPNTVDDAPKDLDEPLGVFG